MLEKQLIIRSQWTGQGIAILCKKVCTPQLAKPTYYTSKDRTLTNVVLMQAQSRKGWANIKPTLTQRLVCVRYMF